MRVSSGVCAKRRIAIALLVCFIVVSLVSATILTKHAHHEHDHSGPGGSCTICAQIQNAENLLRLLGFAAICVYTAFVGAALASAIKTFFARAVTKTLVSSKIRMND